MIWERDKIMNDKFKDLPTDEDIKILFRSSEVIIHSMIEEMEHIYNADLNFREDERGSLYDNTNLIFE